MENTQTNTNVENIEVVENIENTTEKNTSEEAKHVENTVEDIFKSFKTQEEFNNHSASIKGNATKQAQKQLANALGINLDNIKDEQFLKTLGETYKNSLTEQEQKDLKFQDLENSYNKSKSELTETTNLLATVVKMNNINLDDLKINMKMASALVDENTSFEQALEIVNQKMATTNNQTTTNIQSTQIKQNTNNNATNEVIENPFKSNNLTQMGKIIKENPELARKFAQEAKYKNIYW